VTDAATTRTLKLAKGLSLPLDAATQTFAFIARKGAGKTYAAGKLVELLIHAHVQVVVLDTVGNWYGLRLAADGKHPGLDVPVLGGLRGDIPLEAPGGALIADIVVETGRSLVVDMSQFALADRKRFAAAFGERLWQRKKGERHSAPIHLVIEESQLIVPQDVRGDSARMVGIFEEIIRLGRNYGIGVSMITQRPQSVNKEVLNQTECLFVGQVNGAQERDALKKWITHQGMDVHLVDELPGLTIGTFYVWSPQWLNLLERVTILAKQTYDASATPKVGDKRVQRELKPLDLTELQERLKATIEKAKAEDPRELRRQLAELKKQLAAKHSPPVKEKRVEIAVIKSAEITRFERAIGRYELVADALAKAIGPLVGSLHAARSAVHQGRFPDRIADSLRRGDPHGRSHAPGEAVPQAGSDAGLRRREHGAGTANRAALEHKLPPGEQATLTAALQYPGVDRQRLGVLTGYKRSSRDAYIARLTQKGLVDVRGTLLYPTDAGRAALNGAFEPLPSGADLVEYWRHKLPDGEWKTLEVLLAADGTDVARETIDEATGYKRSSRDAYLTRLKARGLVEFSARGLVRAAEALFQ
jgi:hypothetical protein